MLCSALCIRHGGTRVRVAPPTTHVTIRHGSPRVPRQGSGRAVTSSVYPYCRFLLA